MVYLPQAICIVNDVTSPGTDDGFQPGAVLDGLADVDTVLGAYEAFGLVDQVPAEQQSFLREFLATIPPAIEASLLAAARSAMARGVRMQLSWQPGYDFELRVWDVTRHVGGEWHGMVNLHLVSPHPAEFEPFES